MKSSKQFTSRFLVFLIVLFLAGGTGFLWWRKEISSVDSSDNVPISFTIEKGDGVKAIAANLAKKDFIRSPMSFFILVKVMGIERQLQAGDFRLKRSMDAGLIAQELTHGMQDVWVTTLEGWRKEEIATKLARDLDIPEAEFLQYAKEGFMFPDTYRVPRDATAGAVADMFRKTFDQKVTIQMRADAKKIGLSFEDALILASIVEREGRNDEDRPVIAGILLRRLKADWPLQADATLQYALGYQSFEKSWWKKELAEEDKSVQSAFNTYKNPGLPPRAISNPGLASIKAVLYPKETEYWYYLHDAKGTAHYASSIDEHNANITKYLR
ncbi:MAG: endolytic transglycosylase MltG [Patescibacteria group bacterium]